MNGPQSARAQVTWPLISIANDSVLELLEPPLSENALGQLFRENHFPSMSFMEIYDWAPSGSRVCLATCLQGMSCDFLSTHRTFHLPGFEVWLSKCAF